MKGEESSTKSSSSSSGEAVSPSGRLRRRRGPSSEEKTGPRTSAGPATVPVGDMVDELQKELRSERAEVLEPLLHRFADLGQSLRAGGEVPPELIEAGLAILDRYVAQLHVVHIRQFAEALGEQQHPEMCFLPLAQMEGEPERAERRIATIRAWLTGYRGHLRGYANLLGLDLRNEAVAELSWEGYAEDYAKTCIPSHLTLEAAADWRRAFESARQEFLGLRKDVAEFLKRTAYLLPAQRSGPATPSSS